MLNPYTYTTIFAAAAIAGSVAMTTPSHSCDIGLYAANGTRGFAVGDAKYGTWFQSGFLFEVGKPIRQTGKTSLSIPGVKALGREKVRGFAHAFDLCERKARLLFDHSTAGRMTYELNNCTLNAKSTKRDAEEMKRYCGKVHTVTRKGAPKLTSIE